MRAAFRRPRSGIWILSDAQAPCSTKWWSREVTAEFANVRVIADQGLLADLVRREGADVILRGLRGEADLSFEMQMAAANRQIGNIETVFIGCMPEYSMISSTIVRDCAAHGAPIAGMVPGKIIGKIYAAYGVCPDAERKG